MIEKEKLIQGYKDLIHTYEKKIQELENGYELEVPDYYSLEKGFVLISNGTVGQATRFFNLDDFYKQGNWFATVEEAELERDRRELLTKFRQFRDKCNDGWEPDWSDEQEGKFYIFFDYQKRKFNYAEGFDYESFWLFGHFKNREDCKKAIELFGEEIKMLFIEN